MSIMTRLKSATAELHRLAEGSSLQQRLVKGTLPQDLYETRGLWQMVGEENGKKIQYGMGGAFLTYAFYDQPSSRLYLIDGMVFAPNFPKREFLRQLEVIAYTFRTRQEVEQAAQVAARE